MSNHKAIALFCFSFLGIILCSLAPLQAMSNPSDVFPLKKRICNKITGSEFGLQKYHTQQPSKSDLITQEVAKVVAYDLAKKNLSTRYKDIRMQKGLKLKIPSQQEQKTTSPDISDPIHQNVNLGTFTAPSPSRFPAPEKTSTPPEARPDGLNIIQQPTEFFVVSGIIIWIPIIMAPHIVFWTPNLLIQQTTNI